MNGKNTSPLSTFFPLRTAASRASDSAISVLALNEEALVNLLLLIAGILSIIIGLFHTILGEILIFKHLRKGSIIPTAAIPPLRERNVRILWATWHITSIFGWAIGAILLHLSFTDNAAPFTIIQFIAFSMLASGLLVFVATQAKHPGWIGLIGVAILCWLV